jgi:NDP-sugar pyrophosphorylase family protein
MMKMYSHYGLNDFVVCLGYKGYLIKAFFSDYYLHLADITFDVGNNSYGDPSLPRRTLARRPGRYRRRHHDQWATASGARLPG